MAHFFTPGAVELFYRFRHAGNPPPPPVYVPSSPSASPGSSPAAVDAATAAAALLTGWNYLGSSVTAPEIEGTVISTPVTCDLNSPGIFQKVFNSERHLVTASLNRLNYRNWNFLRGDGGGDTETVRVFRGGELMLNSSDVELYVRYAAPNSGVPVPSGAPLGRLYMSATLEDFHETSINCRVQEVTVVFECNPLWYAASRRFQLYSERLSDLPNVTLE